MEHLGALWGQAPAVTRSLVALPLSLHCAGFAWKPQLQLFMDLSLVRVQNGIFWGILTSALWEPPQGILSTVFALLFAYWVLRGLPNLETSMGSGKLLVWMMSASVMINLMFLLLAFILDAVWTSLRWQSVWPYIPCHGLMTLLMFGITLRSLANPEAETSFFGVPMQQKYYPLVLVSIFVLLNGPAALHDIAALAVGYLQGPAKLDSLLPSSGLLQKWESAGCRLLFGRSFFGGRWIRVNEAAGGTGLGESQSGLPSYHVIGRGHGQHQDPSRAATGTQFVMFQGSGRRLGS
eukprot:TRINITY_DN27447_c0_g1_i2.p1 TRINITY_DN27447_c0_g1~~TRINITY_DN27447_c0_g1_i2.p1  ORF type:complete len:304 (-),score=34.00 TRINITY_DN27447_c0_g1_i2:196-1074(-)